jgi:hypothetical protein
MTKKWSSTKSGSGTKRQASKAARKTHVEDDDESFASRAVQAELDHAMGIQNDDYDWLVDPYK